MADSGIKKAIILNNELPAINPETNGYEVRYRVVSEDKNRASHWSPSFVVDSGFTYEPGLISFNKNGSIAVFSWDVVTINKNSKYVWVKWDRGDGGDWIYKQRIDGTGISFPIPSTYSINGIEQPSQPNKVSLEVYLKGNKITRDFDTLLVYEDGPHTI